MTTHVTAQWLVVALVVVASTVYATWTLMPATLRRQLAAALLKLPLPAAVASRLRAVATSASLCGCSGCDRNPLPRTSPDPKAADARPITLHRRLPG